MFTTARRLLTILLRKRGYDMVPFGEAAPDQEFPSDFDTKEVEVIRAAMPYTMTSVERLHALIRAVKYIIHNEIPGDVVECGVWKGGSMFAVARALVIENHQERDLYLFDTFEGMPRPGENDISWKGEKACETFNGRKTSQNSSDWARAGLGLVKDTMRTSGYDPRRIHYVKGLVEETIPAEAPDQIAVLRLDTDWYESTKHELVHLFPRLARGGVLLLDDYGHWMGARKATDEYIEQNQISIFLSRIDFSGRLAIKL